MTEDEGRAILEAELRLIESNQANPSIYGSFSTHTRNNPATSSPINSPVNNFTASHIYFVNRKLLPIGVGWVHDETQVDDKLSSKEKKRSKQLDNLLAIVYPEQRSDEWFKMRSGKITASDVGTVIGCSKYEKEFEFILKKVYGKPFEPNKYCYHGKKYEKIATMIYEYRMNVKVRDFGMIGHPTCDIVGASPDGIVGKYKFDGEHLTKFVGRMIEIKCPMTRQIKTTGDVKADIVPIGYWHQVQLQLHCCDLDECDFWQCDLSEYETYEQFLEDTLEEEPFRSKQTGFEKGCVIQLLPLEKACKLPTKYEEVLFDEATHIYPPSLEMTPLDIDKWIRGTLTDLHRTHPTKIFDKILFWRLNGSHCQLVTREEDWLTKNLPKLTAVWNQVLYLRQNPEDALLLTEYMNSLWTRISKNITATIDGLCNKTIDKKKLRATIEANLKNIEQKKQQFVIANKKADADLISYARVADSSYAF